MAKKVSRPNKESDTDNSRQETIGGFTIIEVAMVIVIVGIMAALTIPRFNTFYGIKLSGAAKKVTSDIRYAQQLAVTRHENYNINFSPNGYTVTRVLGGFAIDPFTRGNFNINFISDPQYGGIAVVTTFGGGILQFNWEGVPCDSAGAPLVSDNNITLSYQGNTRTLIVTRDTGRIVIQ